MLLLNFLGDSKISSYPSSYFSQLLGKKRQPKHNASYLQVCFRTCVILGSEGVMHHIVFWLFFCFLLQMGVFFHVFFFFSFFLMTKAANRRRLISPMWPFQSDIILLATCHLLPHRHRVCWLEFDLQCSVCFWILEASLSEKKKEKNAVAQYSSILERAVNPAVWNPINTVGFPSGGSVYLSDLLSFCSDFFLAFSKNLSREEKKEKLGFRFPVADLNIELTNIPPTFSCFFCRWKRTKQPWFLKRRTWKTFCRPVW